MIRNSIRKKLLILLLTATIVPICSSIAISYFYTKHSVNYAAIDENSSRLELGKNNLISYFNTVNQLSLSVYSGINAADSLYSYLEQSRTQPVDNSAVATSHDLVYLHLVNLFQSNKDIYQLHLYIFNGQQSNLWVNGYFRREYNPDYQPPKGSDGTYRPFLEPTHLIHRYGMNFLLPESKLSNVPVLTLHRPIYWAPSTEALAFLSIDLSMDSFNRICEQLYNPDLKERLLITDEEGRYFYSSEPRDYGGKLTQPWSAKLAGTTGSGYFDWSDQQFAGLVFYDHMETPYMKATMIKQIPYTDLYRGANAITRINTLIAAGFLILAVIGTVIISFQLTQPIKQLIGYVNKVQTGNLRVPLEVRNNDEIGLLARRMQAMMETIDQLILREYRLELANKTNQLKMLQAQVNPHFLYNAMQSIGTQALHANAPETYRLITSLAKMMRYSMATDETEVPLRREVEHVKAYLDLQKERFGEQFEFALAFEPNTLDVRIPKMVLQPIVENYFKHGYAGSGEQGEIRLSGVIRDGKLQLTALDNGSGMDPERLSRLEAQLAGSEDGNPRAVLRAEEPEGGGERGISFAQEAGGGSGIGLMNVVSRLRLSVGSGVRMQLANRQPTGFSVQLEIPLSPAEEEGQG